MRDDSVGKGINLIGTVVVALLIVGVLIAFAYLVISKVNGAKDDVAQQADAALEYKYTSYEGEVVTGSDVLTAITKFKNDTLYICVDNGLTTTYYNLDANLTTAGAEKIATAKSKSDINHYINPSSHFVGEVMYQNDAIVGIKFTKN